MHRWLARFEQDHAREPLLFLRACHRERTPEMELIARSISSTEPGGALIIDPARALLNGPGEARPEATRA
ncbi:MAG: hypothetical protein ABSG41_24560 [Bryobacteraceae bacterium]